MSGNVHVVDCVFFFQAEDGIRDLVRSRGLGDVYKRQVSKCTPKTVAAKLPNGELKTMLQELLASHWFSYTCLLYTSDAADERSSVDLGGRRIIKKKKIPEHMCKQTIQCNHYIE